MTKEYFTAKHERFFYSVMMSEDYTLMESLLETILKEKVKIVEYPRTQLNIKNKHEKAKVSDIIIKLENKVIHLEVETGVGENAVIKNFTNFCTLISQNSTRGGKYDKKTLFIHITLQFNEGYKKYRIMDYHVQTNKRVKFIKNVKLYKVNVDRIVKSWYDKNEKEIGKYKYIIMLNLEREELEKLGKRDRIVKLFTKRLNTLNDDIQYVNISREEQKRILHNTEVSDAFENGAKQNSIEIAKKMFAMNGITMDQIRQATGLTKKELEELKVA